MGNILNNLEDVLSFNTKDIFSEIPKDQFYNSIGTLASAEDAVKRSIDQVTKINQSVKLFNMLIEKFADSNFDMLPLAGVITQLPEHILIVGCGGVGSWFLPKFVKLINDGKRKNLIPALKTVTLCDGDDVEESNLIRQNFATRDVTKNKAECLFKRYAGELNNTIAFGYIDKYILEQVSISKKKTDFQSKFISFDKYLTSVGVANRNAATSILIINLIDNNETRKDIHAFAGTSEFPINKAQKVFVLDVACAAYNGQLNLSNPFNYVGTPSQNRLNLTNCLGYFDQITENAFLNDKISVFDCSVRDANAVEQLFDINNLAATVLCSYMNTWIEKSKLFYKQVSFSTGQNISIKPQYKIYDINFDCYSSLRARGNTYDLESFYNEAIQPIHSVGMPLSSSHSLVTYLNNGRAKGGNNKKLFRSLANTIQVNHSYSGDFWYQFKRFFIDIDKDDKTNSWASVFLLTKDEGDKFYKNAYSYAANLRNQAQSANELIVKELFG